MEFPLIPRSAHAGDAEKREYARPPSAPRNYVEAYPVLTATNARRASHILYSSCVWLDPTSRTVAAARLRWETTEQLVLAYGLDDTGEVLMAGETMLAIAWEGSRADNKRPLLVCPRCGMSRSSLVLKDVAWVCRLCHGLHYRSTRIGSAVGRAEKYKRLRQELNALLADCRRKDVIQRKEAEVERALARAGPLPHPVASATYDYRLTFKWSGGWGSVD